MFDRSTGGFFASISLLIGIAAGTPAQTNLNWTGGGADSNWTTTANWGGSAYPNNGQPTAGDSYNATVNGNFAPVLNSDITLNSLSYSAGTLSGSGDLTINGPFDLAGGNLLGSGTITLNGGGFLNGGNLSQPMANSNNATLTLGGLESNSANAVLTNSAGATFVMPGSAFLNANTGIGVFNNAGTVQKTSGSNSDIEWTFNNARNVSVISGTLDLKGGGTDTGSYSVSSGALLDFVGGVRSVNGAVTGSGNVSIRTVYGSYTPTVTIGGPANAYAVTGDTTVSGTNATAYFNSAASTGTLHLNGISATIDGSGALTVNGLFTWTSGNLQGSGSLILNGGASLAGAGLNRAVFNESGSTVNAANGIGSVSANAVWNNLAGFIFNLTSDSGLSAGSGGAGTFTNYGTFQKTGTATSGNHTSTIAWNFTNAGTVNIAAGILNFTTTGTDTGGYTIAGGATLSFSANRSLNGPVTGAGMVTINLPATLTIGGAANAYAITGTTMVGGNGATASASIIVNISTSFGPLILNLNSILDGAGDVTVNGLLSCNLSTLQGSGNTILNGGASVNSQTNLNRNVTNAAGSTVSIRSGLYTQVANLTWNNQAGSTFAMVGDTYTGPSRTNFTGTFTNDGLFQKTGGTGSGGVGWSFINTGTVICLNAALTFEGANGPQFFFTPIFSNSGAVVGNGGTVAIGTYPDLTNYSNGVLTGGTWRAIAGGGIAFGSRAVSTIAAGTTVEVNGATSTFGAVENQVTANAGSLNILGGHVFTPGGTLVNTGFLTVGQSAGDGSQFSGGVTVNAGGILRGTGTIAPPVGSTVAVNSGGTIMGGQAASAGVLALALPMGQDLALAGFLGVNMSGTAAPDANGLSPSTSRIAFAGGGLSMNGASLVLDFSGMGSTGGIGNDPNGNGNGFWTNTAGYNDAAQDGYVWRVIDAGADESGAAPTVSNPAWAYGTFTTFIGTGGPLSLSGGGDPGAVYLAFTPVPEPSSFLLFGAAAGTGVGLSIRRRRPK
jgi:hypothetical protein